MYLDWWMIIVLVFATGLWAEWRNSVGALRGYKDGIGIGGKLVTAFLIKENYLKIDIDGAAAKPIRWPAHDALTTEKIAEFVKAQHELTFDPN